MLLVLATLHVVLHALIHGIFPMPFDRVGCKGGFFIKGVVYGRTP